MNRCWICTEAANTSDIASDMILVVCRRCGEYTISGSLAASASTLRSPEQARLSGWCRHRKIHNHAAPKFTEYSLQAVLAALPNPTPTQRADYLLVGLAALHPTPGEAITYDLSYDYSMAYAKTPAEGRLHLAALDELTLEVHVGHSRAPICEALIDCWCSIDRPADINNAQTTLDNAVRIFVGNYIEVFGT